MPQPAVKKFLVKARMENVQDLFQVSKGKLQAVKVRTVEIPDAVVDPSASIICLPQSLIAKLGLQAFGWRKARTNAGNSNVQMYGILRLTIQGHAWNGDAGLTPNDCPVIIGQLALVGLGLGYDPVNKRLVADAEKAGEEVIELEL